MALPMICPVCGGKLQQQDRRYTCPKGHSFDRAASGYVNLSMSQASSAKRHGDDKMMIRARTEFLSTGAYSCLSDKLVQLSLPLLKNGDVFLDAGCGEGHYISLLADALAKRGRRCPMIGIDLSKEALIAAAKRKADLTLAVASVFHMPVADDSISLLWNVFAPIAGEEYARVLKKGGHLIRVFPMEDHLLEFKEQIYDNVYRNRPVIPEIDGLQLLCTHRIRKELTLDNQKDIGALFMMTPYYYKTSAADQAKIARLTSLTTTLDFAISIYKKI